MSHINAGVCRSGSPVIYKKFISHGVLIKNIKFLSNKIIISQWKPTGSLGKDYQFHSLIIPTLYVKALASPLSIYKLF